MTTADRSKMQVIRLGYAAGKVVVTPEDEDRFVLTAQHAVTACQNHHRQDEAVKSFKIEFLGPLIDWCKRHADRVRACYIPVPLGYVQVFIVGSSYQYDFDLGRAISRLELELADSGWSVNVLQLPNSDDEEDLQTYFAVEGALQAYA